MKISYVLPVYNSFSFLADTIESLLSQKHKDFELIVIDDYSTDEIAPLKEHYTKNKKIRWVRNPVRKGAAYCRNFANTISNGDIIFVCDAGDFYVHSRTKKVLDYFNKNPDKDIVYSHVQINTPFDEPIFTQNAVDWDGESKPPISHPTVAYRKDVVASYSRRRIKYHEGSFDTDFYEFFMIDAHRAGYKFGFIEKILCVKKDLSELSNYRNVILANELKEEKYKKYNISREIEFV